MAFDFPNSPTLNQTYSVSGGPTYIWNGTAWVVLTSGTQFERVVFTATAGQTTFSASYMVGAIDVYRNGVKLVNTSDFTATNGTSVVLLNAATAGDTIEIISYAQLIYADAVKRTGDTMTGNLTVTANVTANNYVVPSASGYVVDTSGQNGIGIFGASGIITGYTSNLERFRIDSSGRMTLPYQPCFSVTGPYSGGLWTISTSAGSGYVILYNGIHVNRGNHYNSSTGRFTAPVAGCYFFSASITAAGAYSGPQLIIRVNGGGQSGNILAYTSTGYCTASQGWILSLNAGDYVDVYWQANNATAAIDMSRATFTGHLLG